MTERDLQRLRVAVKKRFQRLPSPSEEEALTRAVVDRERRMRTSKAVRQVIERIGTCVSLMDFVYSRTNSASPIERPRAAPRRADLEPTAYLLDVIDGARSLRLVPVARLAGDIVYWPIASARKVRAPETRQFLLASTLDAPTRALGWIHPQDPRLENLVTYHEVPSVAALAAGGAGRAAGPGSMSGTAAATSR